MNRLQKKCVIATAGFHLLLLLILFLGPGFFTATTEQNDMPILKVIPLTAVDSPLSSGVAHPQPPPVAPPQPQPQPVVTPPQPVPDPPKQVVTPPEPVHQVVHQPTPKPVEPDTPDDKPVDVPDPVVKIKPKTTNKIEVDITHHVKRTVPKNQPKATEQEDADAKAQAKADAQAAKAAKAAQQKLAAAFSHATADIQHKATASTDVDLPGDSKVSVANYGQFVKSIYEEAWIVPDNADNDEANPKVRVVIARDGSVISARIITPSGDAAVDASVQRVLDRVRTIRPFPEGSTDKERSYIINFNLKAKRMLG